MNQPKLKIVSLLISIVLMLIASTLVLLEPTFVPPIFKPLLVQYVSGKTQPSLFPYYVYALFFCLGFLGFLAAFNKSHNRVLRLTEWLMNSIVKSGFRVVVAVAVVTTIVFFRDGPARAAMGLALASLVMLMFFSPAWIAQQHISLLNGEGVKRFPPSQLRWLNLGLSAGLVLLAAYGTVAETLAG